MKGKGILFGLLSGAIFGALFAPESGKKIREKFKKEREKGGSGMDTLKNSLMDMGSDVLESMEEMNPEDEHIDARNKKNSRKK